MSAEEVETLSRIFANDNDLRAVAAAVRADPSSLNGVMKSELRENEVPTLLVVGELDRRSDEARAMARVMSHAEVLVVPGASHVRLPELPEFLTAIPGSLAKFRDDSP